MEPQELPVSSGRGLVRRFFGWMGAELPKLLAGIVLLVLAYWIKDSVDLSIKQRQLDLSYATQLQSSLQSMANPDAGKPQLQATAVVLASFGEAALPALISELRYPGLRADAAIVGLSTLSLTRPQSICDALPRLLTNRGKQLDWSTHEAIVRLLGEGECKNSLKTLRNYRMIVAAAMNGDGQRFEELVSAKPIVPATDYPELLQAIDRSLAMFDP